MRKELELHLVDLYPSLFRDYGGSPRTTCMAWGCTHGDGWFGILANLCQQIDKECEGNAELKKDFKFTQVKEKWGILHVYTSGGNKVVYDFIRQAEQLSGKTCEECGTTDNNVTTKGGWIRTLCDPCRKAAQVQARGPVLSPLELMTGKQ